MSKQRTIAKPPSRRAASGPFATPSQLAGFANVAQVALAVVVGGTVRFASRQAEQLLASQPGGLNGRKMRSLFPLGGKANSGGNRTNRTPKNGVALRFEAACRRPDGATLWVDVRMTRTQWDGRPAELAILTDITARKRADADLLSSEQRYRHLVEASPQGIAIVRQGRVVMSNRAFAAIFDADGRPSIPPGRRFESVLAPRERNRFRDQIRQQLSGRSKPARTEFEARRADGSAVWIETLSDRIDWEGEPALMLSVADISQRRAETAALLAERQLLEAVFEAVPGRLFVTDRNGRYVRVSAEHAQSYRMEPADLVGELNSKFAARHGISAAVVKAEERRLFSTGRRIDIPMRMQVNEDGRKTWLKAVKVALRNPQGRIIGQLALLTDVTELRLAQDELRASRQLLQAVFDAVPERLFAKDRDSRYLKVNQAHARAFGLTPDAAVGMTTAQFAKRIGLDAREIRAQDARVMRTGKPLNLPEALRQLPGGTERWYREIKVPLRDERGRITGIVGLAIDITERRQTEEALRRSEDLLQKVLDALPIAIWVKNLQGQFVKVNRTQAENHGVLPSDMEGHTWDAFAPRVGGDVGQALAEDEAVMRRGERVEVPEQVHRIKGQGSRWVRIIKVPLRDTAGAIAGVVGLSVDTTERRNAEEALRRSEQLMQTILDTLPIAIFVKDLDGRYVKVNRTQAEHFGLKPADMEGRVWDGFAPRIGGDIAQARAEDEAVTQRGERVEVPEQALQYWGQGQRWVRIIKVPLRGTEGGIGGIVGMAIDVTERRAADQALQAQRRLLRTVIDALPVRITVKDAAGRFLILNRAHVEATNAPESAYVGKTIHEIQWVPRLRQELYEQKEAEALRARTPVEIPELDMGEQSGKRQIGRMIKAPILDERGEPEGLVTLWEDITDRLSAEEELRRSRRLLQTVFDAMPLAITVKDASKRYVMANQAYIEQFATRETDLIGRTVEEAGILPADLVEPVSRADDEVLAKGRLVELAESHMLIGGLPRVHRILKVPLLDEQGRTEGLVTLSEDITDRLSADQELRRSRRLLRTVFDAIPIVMTVKDASKRYVMANRAYLSLYEVAEADLIGRTTPEMGLLTPDLIDLVRSADDKVLADGKLLEIPENQTEVKGVPRMQRILKVPLIDEAGRTEGLVTLSEDITARLSGESELRRNRRLLQVVFDLIPHHLFVRDVAGRFIMANTAIAEFFGTIPDRMVGKPLDAIALTQETAHAWLAQDRKAIETGATVVSEDYRAQDAKGTEVWLHSVKLPLRDEDGTIAGVVGLSEDITARKHAELALLENQRLLESAQAVGHLGSWSANLATGEPIRCSDEALRIFGSTRENFSGRFAEIREHVHPDDRAGYEATFRSALKAGLRYEHEHRIAGPSGEIRWLHERADIQRNPQGRATSLVGFVQDITERKQAELALAASERLLHAVLDTIPHNVFVKDRNSRYTLVNRAFHRFWGTEGIPADKMPQTFPGVPPELADVWLRTDRAVMETGNAVEREADLVYSAAGRKVWLRWIKVPHRDEHGQIVGLVGISEDISVRIEAEAALRTQQRLLQVVFDTIPQQVFIKDTQSRFVLANTGFARFYGLTPHQLQGLPSSELPGVPEAEGQDWAIQDQGILETGQPVHLPEVRLSDPRGGETWFDLRKYPWLDDQNRVIGIVGVREDISERRHIEERVRANRRLLRTVFDTIPHLLYVKDVNSRYIMVNQALAGLYGMTPEGMAGMHTLDMPGNLPEQRRELIATDRLVIRDGVPVHQPEVPVFESGRGDRWYAMTKLPLRNEEGKIVGLVGMSEDITERRQAQQELQTNRRLLRAVFDAVPFWLMVRDIHGRATLINRRMAEDYGVEPEAFLGKVMEADPHLKPAEKETMQAISAEVDRTLLPVAVSGMAVTLPGERVRLMRMVVIPLFDNTGAREGSLILAEDITERKRSEDALLQAQKLESLGVLAGGIAHDFNNLLVAVLGNASLALLKLKEDAPGRQELQQIELAGQRAAELCRQMLAYAGKSPLETQRVDVNSLVREMTQLLKVSLPKGVAIGFRLADELPRVDGDPTQIRQVVMNLVINAGEAIGDKQGVITLSTGTQTVDLDYLASCQSAPEAQPGRFLFVEVSDTGHGMSPETLSRIFDPFFTTKFTGRGLGLASVLGIIRAHRGALRVYSEIGVGTAFRVLLPIAGPPRDLQDSVVEPQAWTGGGEVLIVDDEADVLAIGEKMLAYLGFTVVTAVDGPQAISILRGHPSPFRAALVDLTMPGMAGEDVVRELRRIQDLPVLVMSGYSERDVQNRFIGRKKTEFLQKPFTLSGLHAKMRALLGDPAPE